LTSDTRARRRVVGQADGRVGVAPTTRHAPAAPRRLGSILAHGRPLLRCGNGSWRPLPARQPAPRPGAGRATTRHSFVEPAVGLLQAGVEGVAEAVAEEVEAEHGDEDGEAWEERDPGVGLDERHVGFQVPAPARRRRLGAEPEEAERRLTIIEVAMPRAITATCAPAAARASAKARPRPRPPPVTSAT